MKTGKVCAVCSKHAQACQGLNISDYIVLNQLKSLQIIQLSIFLSLRGAWYNKGLIAIPSIDSGDMKYAW